jgi:hypothetical protein
MNYKKVPKKYTEKKDLILDVGGWAKPFKEATHVVDLFPWETRGYGLYLDSLPGEKFSKKTWYQIDFIEPGMNLPFEDNKFDFSICSQTLEDLVNPAPIIKEIIRVSREGYIETPSRFDEQTIGIRDGKSKHTGHPHHKWIVEKESSKLKFFNKSDSVKEGELEVGIPYMRWKNTKKDRKGPLEFTWKEAFDFEFIFGNDAKKSAKEYKRKLEISKSKALLDYLKRKARRIRDNIKMKGDVMENWKEIVNRSKMYSEIKLE